MKTLCINSWSYFLWNLLHVGSREEQEKLNVWVALLNLENMYGTEESLKKVFERALQFCEPMPVYQQLADIYTKSDKIKVRSTDCLLSCPRVVTYTEILSSVATNIWMSFFLCFICVFSWSYLGGRGPL